MIYDDPCIKLIREHLGDALSETLFDGHLEYSASGDPYALGAAVGRYFSDAGAAVRRDCPELFALAGEALSRGIPSGELIMSPQALRFYTGLGGVPEQFTDIYNCYFDSGIVRFGAGEVFVDGGAQDLFTSFRFAKKTRGKYGAIYAFEPSEKNYYECMGNKALFDGVVHVSAAALSDRTAFVGFTEDKQNSHIDDASGVHVQAAALDDCLEGIDPTYIKLHLEGGEYAALIGAEKTVRRAAPRLAVCVDHCAEDIVRIPQKILEYDSAYKLYLRHYSTSITETVLYAVK